MSDIFQVKIDENIIYDYRTDKLEIYNPKLTLEANTTNSFNFKIYDNHFYYDQIQKLRSIVKVYQKDKLIFRGRVLEDTEDFHRAKTIDCEGELAFLLDSVYRPFDWTGKTVSVRQFFALLIENHNRQVKDFQKFILGDITVEDPNEKINFSSESAMKTWDIIKTRLIDNYGGYLYITYNKNEMPILNYLKELPNTAIQTIELGKNILDISKLVSATEIATACIPYGAKIKDKEENETKERVNIKSVNNGNDFLINEEMANIYGIIYADPSKTTWEDVTLASNLLTKAEEFLGESVKLSSTIELKAVDLSNVEDIQAFHFLDYIRIFSTYHNLDTIYVLEKLELDLFNPQSTVITLGETIKTITDISKSNNSDLVSRITHIESDYVTNELVSNMVSEEISNSTAIKQTAEEVVIGVMEDYVKTSDYTTYKETISANIQVLAEGIIANLNTTTSQIEGVNGDLQQKYEKLIGWIRGYQNATGQPVIELGEAQSTIKLKLENDEIYFDVNGVKRFYLTAEGKIVFKNAVFEETTEINGFAYVPRSNRNLSFVKVKGV